MNCEIRPYQSSKTINANKTKVTYTISVPVYHLLGGGGYQYYNTTIVNATFTSPGPRSTGFEYKFIDSYIDSDLVGTFLLEE